MTTIQGATFQYSAERDTKLPATNTMIDPQSGRRPKRIFATVLVGRPLFGSGL